MASILVCLGWAVGCAVYDGSLVGSNPKTDAGTGGSSPGVGGSSAGGGSVGGDDIGAGGSDPTEAGPTATGGGGSAGTAGGGSGGADGGAAEAAPAGTELLIDSMEHAGDGISGAGFSGHWYVFNDQTDGGVETPYPFMMTTLDAANAALPASTQAAHATGTGFTGFGCGMGFSISAAVGRYNASAYTGITFWARVGTGAQTHITVSTFDTRAETGCVKCNDQPLTSFDATAIWQKIHLPFAQFRQAGFGEPQFGVFDPKGFGGAQFYVGGGTKLDVWIDDVAFYAQ